MIEYLPVTTEEELNGILHLQQRNLPAYLSPEEIESQGFVTVSHQFEDLQKLHAIEPGIIAKDDHKVIGYALAMTSGSADSIPVLQPMFDVFETIEFKGRPVSAFRYIVVGQVCIDKAYRGKGVFDQLYQCYVNHFRKKYDFAITEIDTRNLRSLHAHKRLEFECIHEYISPDGKQWSIVIRTW